MTSADSLSTPGRWHRPLVPEDVETARGIIEMHIPTDTYRDRPICASATHLVVAPYWPCAQHRWAEWVLDSEQRGQIAS